MYTIHPSWSLFASMFHPSSSRSTLPSLPNSLNGRNVAPRRVSISRPLRPLLRCSFPSDPLHRQSRGSGEIVPLFRLPWDIFRPPGRTWTLRFAMTRKYLSRFYLVLYGTCRHRSRVLDQAIDRRIRSSANVVHVFVWFLHRLHRVHRTVSSCDTMQITWDRSSPKTRKPSSTTTSQDRCSGCWISTTSVVRLKGDRCDRRVGVKQEERRNMLTDGNDETREQVEAHHP